MLEMETIHDICEVSNHKYKLNTPSTSYKSSMSCGSLLFNFEIYHFAKFLMNYNGMWPFVLVAQASNLDLITQEAVNLI